MKQKWVLQVIVMMFGCTLLLASLSWLSTQGDKAGGAYTVFAEEQPAMLTNDNLVEGLSALELPTRIGKVNLNRSILSVDLKVTEDDFDVAKLYQGMAELISFSMERTSNVDQLLLRLVAEDKWLGTRYLLLAADVRRGQWPETALENLRNVGNKEIPKELQTWFRMTETHLWKSKFRDL